MAAKTKANSAAKKKPVKKAVAKKTVVKKAPAKKIAVEKKVRKTKPLVAELKTIANGKQWQARPKLRQDEFTIQQIYVSNMMVFGLAVDQRVYRWNPRSAVWVLHKDGLQP